MSKLAEFEVLRSYGWRTAAEIIEQWNAENGTDENPTIAGQLLARMGLHRREDLRTPKKPGRQCLYSPEAQVLIRREL